MNYDTINLDLDYEFMEWNDGSDSIEAFAELTARLEIDEEEEWE